MRLARLAPFAVTLFAACGGVHTDVPDVAPPPTVDAGPDAEVEEVIRDGENGLLVDFFSTEQIAARVDEALSMKDSRLMRERARATVIERYDLRRVCLPAQLGLVARLKDQGADAGPAADVEHLAGDEARVPVGEEQHRARHVAGLT